MAEGGWGKLVAMGVSAGVTLLLVKRLRRIPHVEVCDESSPSFRVHWAPQVDATPAPPATAAAGGAQERQSAPHPSALHTVLLETIALIASVVAAVALAQHVPGGALPAAALVLCSALCSFLLGASLTSPARQAAAESVTPHATTPAPPEPQAQWIKPEMAGVWVKVHSLSDPMDAACNAMHLNGIVRVAVRLVRGIEVHIQQPADGAQGPGYFELAVFSVFPWFKVRERYELDGAVSKWNRRDLRRGTHQGYLQVLPSGKLYLHLKWPEPYGGTGSDEFILMGPNELHVLSQLQLSGSSGTTTFKTVYMRKH